MRIIEKMRRITRMIIYYIFSNNDGNDDININMIMKTLKNDEYDNMDVSANNYNVDNNRNIERKYSQIKTLI